MTFSTSFSLPSIPKLIKIVVLVLLCGLIAGVAGLMTVALMYWMTYQPIAIDNHEKHGISHQKASRLGGVAVAFCTLCLYWILVGLEISLERASQTILQSPFTYGLLIGLVGFCDDLFGHLSAKARIVLTTIIFASFLLLNPDYVPTAIGISGIDLFLNYHYPALLLCLVGCLGMLNASNMADGANGLMPLVFLGTFFGFFLITAELIYFALTMGLMVFALFNVLSGRLFLGDAGAYGLGAIAVLSAIKFMGETGAEVWFFLCLSAYPVIDFFVSVIRRKISGRSPLSPDNDHMHNRMYRFVRHYFPKPLVANSVSGLILSILTTGVTLVLSSVLSIDSKYWVTVFLMQVIIYVLIYRLLPNNDIPTCD